MPAVYTPTSSIPELKQNRKRTLVGSTGLIEVEEEEEEEEEVVGVRFADANEGEEEEREEEEDCNNCDCDGTRADDAFKEVVVVEGVDVIPPPIPPMPEVLLVSSPMDGPLLGDDGCATCALGSSSQS
jgi:hypothetical protein